MESRPGGTCLRRGTENGSIEPKWICAAARLFPSGIFEEGRFGEEDEDGGRGAAECEDLVQRRERQADGLCLLRRRTPDGDHPPLPVEREHAVEQRMLRLGREDVVAAESSKLDPDDTNRIAEVRQLLPLVPLDARIDKGGRAEHVEELRSRLVPRWSERYRATENVDLTPRASAVTGEESSRRIEVRDGELGGGDLLAVLPAVAEEVDVEVDEAGGLGEGRSVEDGGDGLDRVELVCAVCNVVDEDSHRRGGVVAVRLGMARRSGDWSSGAGRESVALGLSSGVICSAREGQAIPGESSSRELTGGDWESNQADWRWLTQGPDSKAGSGP